MINLTNFDERYFDSMNEEQVNNGVEKIKDIRKRIDEYIDLGEKRINEIENAKNKCLNCEEISAIDIYKDNPKWCKECRLRYCPCGKYFGKKGCLYYMASSCKKCDYDGEYKYRYWLQKICGIDCAQKPKTSVKFYSLEFNGSSHIDYDCELSEFRLYDT